MMTSDDAVHHGPIPASVAGIHSGHGVLRRRRDPGPGVWGPEHTEVSTVYCDNFCDLPRKVRLHTTP